MPSVPAAIVPSLLMPAVRVRTSVILTPVPAAAMCPLLTMPPRNVEIVNEFGLVRGAYQEAVSARRDRAAVENVAGEGRQHHRAAAGR